MFAQERTLKRHTATAQGGDLLFLKKEDSPLSRRLSRSRFLYPLNGALLLLFSVFWACSLGRFWRRKRCKKRLDEKVVVSADGDDGADFADLPSRQQHELEHEAPCAPPPLRYLLPSALICGSISLLSATSHSIEASQQTKTEEEAVT